MVDIIKQDMTDIWASSGDKTAPDPSKIATGWVVEAVPRQWWNWFENRQDQNIAYMLQKGIPEWDSFTEYLTNKSYVQRNNIVYKCIQTATNQDPSTAPLYWVKAFPESSDSLEAIRTLTPTADKVAYYTGANSAALMTVTAFARTLLDDANVTTMRSTLGAQATHPNLTALSGAASPATNTLAYFNSATTMIVTPFTAFGRSLIDDADAAAARTTLELGTAALSNMTTSTTDITDNAVTKVGDFGIGAGATTASKFVPTWPNTSLNDITGVGSGLYRTVGGTTNSINGAAAIIIYAVQNYDAIRATQLLISTDGSGVTNNMVFRSCNGGTFAAPTWSTTEDMASKAEVYAQMAEFGLGTTSGVTVTDLNTITTTGAFRFTGSATNIPLASAAGTVWNIVYDASYRTQTVITLSGGDATKYNRLFTRTYNSGAWGTWKESVDSDSLTNTLTDYALNGVNTDITSLSSVTLAGTTTLGTTLRTQTGDATTVPSSGGSLVTPVIRLSDNAAAAKNVLALQGYSFSTGNFGSTLVGTRSSGAIGAHGALATGKSVLTLLGAASDGTKYNPTSRIDMYTTEAQTTSAAGGEIQFLTTRLGTIVPALSATITSAGGLSVVGAISAASMSLTTALPVTSGGTGATTATTARANLQAVGYDATTGSAALPAGTTAQRTASPVNGQLRYNSDNNEFEGYINGAWGGIGGGTPLFTVLWWPSRTAIPAGYIAADGQLLTRTTYSAAWARVNAGDVPLVSDATWLATSTSRASYSSGDGSTTFRTPDLNGKASGTVAAPFLRGDGTNSTGVAGQFQGDQFQGHQHSLSSTVSASSTGGGVQGVASSGVNTGQTITTISDGTNGTPRVGSETRPTNVTGVFIIKLIGGASAASQEDASVAVAALDARVSVLSGRNRIINGDCRITQKPAVAVVAGNSTHGGVDRFRAANGANGQFTQAATTIVEPATGITRYGVRQTVNTAVTTLTTTNFWGGIGQVIEGFNCADLLNTQIVVSFLFQSNISGTFTFALGDSTSSQSYVNTFVAVANTPVKVTFTTTVPASAVIPSSNTAGIYVRIGSLNTGTYQTSTLGSWQAGNLLAANTNTNWGATINNYISVADLQLENGAVATPFERKSYGEELALCQRYYYRLLQNQPIAMGHFRASTTTCAYMMQHPVKMRTTPTVGFSAAAALNVYCSSGAPLSASNGVTTSGEDAIWLSTNISGSAIADTPAMIVVANNQFIEVSAEI